MSSEHFQDSVLWMTPRSPFARRVRVALIECGVRFTEKQTDVFSPTEEFLALNPIGRVPVLCLRSGIALIESHLIVQKLYESSSSKLLPKSEAASSCLALRWSAIATGVCEAVVADYLDSLGPSSQRNTELRDELEAVAERSLRQLETQLSRTGIDWIDQDISFADLDLGCALTYLSLRSGIQWRERFKLCAAYVDRLETRASMRQTCPPPVA